MTSPKLIFPSFDTLELTEAPEPEVVRFETLSPVRAGAIVAGLRTAHHHGRWHRFFDEIVFTDNTNTFSYVHKPILLYFYEQDWGATSQEHLRQLNAIRYELRYRQINILVITAGSVQGFREQAWAEGLSLEIYEDRNNELAGFFRLHAEQSPTWSRYAGVDRNVPLPGIYLLNHSRHVAFAYPNEEIRQELPLQQLLDALPHHTCHPERKSA